MEDGPATVKNQKASLAKIIQLMDNIQQGLSVNKNREHQPQQYFRVIACGKVRYNGYF